MKTTINIGLSVCLLAICGCASVEDRWQQAESANTRQAYSAFLRDYKSSVHAPEAWDRIVEMDWEGTVERNTIDAYREFLRKYKGTRYVSWEPINQTKYVKEAENRIKILEEPAAYEKAIRSNTIEALGKFLSDHPNTTKRHEIETRISEIERKTEDEFYRSAVDSSSYEAFDSYIKRYPDGRYADELKERLASFSWTVLSIPKLLLWKQIGMREPVNTRELSDHLRNSRRLFSNTIWWTEGAEALVMLSRLVFCREDALLRGVTNLSPSYNISPSYVFLSKVKEADSPNVVQFRIGKGFRLLQVNMFTILPVGSVLVIEEQSSPIILYGHPVRRGTVRVVSEGLELQAGTELFCEQKH